MLRLEADTEYDIDQLKNSPISALEILVTLPMAPTHNDYQIVCECQSDLFRTPCLFCLMLL